MEIRCLTENVREIEIEHVRVFILDNIPSGEKTLVDTGFERTAESLVNTLTSEYDSIENLILTHDGGDHHGGVEAVMNTFNPDLYVAKDETGLINSISASPDCLFSDGDTLFDSIEIIQVPGHSPCPSALYLIEHDALISGDTLDGSDRRGLPAGYLLPPPEKYNWDHARAESGLKKLQGYDIETVYVFHGSHVYEDASTKIDKYINF